MAEKSLLIVCDEPKGELSLAFERALKFLPDEEYKIKKVSYEFDWKKPSESPDVLLILDANPQDFSYTSGVGFLRKIWAAGLKQKLPPTILLSFDTPQKLFQRDERHVVTLLEGVEHITLPAKLGDIIEKIENSHARPDVETAKKYLKISCELGFERRIEHARRNFIGPYSLILGARCVNNVSASKYEQIINSPKSSEDRDELRIYDAVLGSERKGSDIKSDAIDDLLKKDPLSKILKGKKILLIDDECKTAGWEEVLKAIFGSDITLDAVGKENNQDTKWKEWADVDNNSDINLKLAVHPDKGLIDYDLILSDLYLTDEDNEKRGDGSKSFHKYSGLQLLEKIRKQDQSVPVILFTASSRAFNVKAAEEIGIDGYFQKEGRYHNEDEAVRYYAEFRNLIEKSTSQGRKALREVWKGINKCTNINYIPDMKDAFELLGSYLKTPKPVYPSSAINRLGSLVEKIYGEKNTVINSVDEILNNMTSRAHYKTKIKNLHAFIAYWLRHAAAHSSSQMTFEDALFTFFAVIKALGINLRIDWEAPCLTWNFDTTVAEAMIDSICNVNCTNECHSFFKKHKLVCNGKEILEMEKKNNEWIPLAISPLTLTSVNKAQFLSLGHNLKSNQAKNKQIFFRYLFYTLCFKAIKEDVPSPFKYLIKSRFTDNGNFCPPFKDGYWVGIEQADGSINSPLGKLKTGMCTGRKPEGDKVLFHLTKEYLCEKMASE